MHGRARIWIAASLLSACGAPATTPTDAGSDAHGDGGFDALVAMDLGGQDLGGAPDLGPDAGCTTDADGDGHASLACGGDDCDDADAHRFPGNAEVCDAAGHDDDCDPATLGPDADTDTFVSVACCNHQTDGTTLCGTDCDDTAIGVNPGSPESCNGVDDNCNVLVDEGVLPTWYRDADMDGFGSPTAATMMTCLMPTGYVATNTDCLDSNALAHPGGTEVCDAAMVDEDCSGAGNDRIPPCACIDGTTSACVEPGVCATHMRNCIDGMWGVCPYVPVPESCPPNGLDDNCNGFVDEGITMITCYVDADLDGYPSPDDPRTMRVCSACPSGFTSRPPTAANLDCADHVPTAHPGGTSQTAPYCVDPANSVCVQMSMQTCIMTSAGCPSASLGVASYDYDCDGLETPATACGPCGSTCACH